MNGWHTRQLDFVLAYPQAPVECDLYMEIPYGYNIKDPEKYALKLKKNSLWAETSGSRMETKLPHGPLLFEKLVFHTEARWMKCMFYFNDCIVPYLR